MSRYFEKPGSKRMAIGAAMIGAGACGFLYLTLHHAPWLLEDSGSVVEGKSILSCPSRQLGEVTIFRCTFPDGTHFETSYPTSETTNTGPFAGVENTLDRHFFGATTATDISIGLGMSLLLGGILRRARREEDGLEPEPELLPDESVEIREYTVHRGDLIPLEPYQSEGPVAFPE